MARSPFSVYTRTGKDCKKLFCDRFFDGDKVIKSVTLWEAKSPTAAARLAESMYKNGDCILEQQSTTVGVLPELLDQGE